MMTKHYSILVGLKQKGYDVNLTLEIICLDRHMTTDCDVMQQVIMLVVLLYLITGHILPLVDQSQLPAMPYYFLFYVVATMFMVNKDYQRLSNVNKSL